MKSKRVNIFKTLYKYRESLTQRLKCGFCCVVVVTS